MTNERAIRVGMHALQSEGGRRAVDAAPYHARARIARAFCALALAALAPACERAQPAAPQSEPQPAEPALLLSLSPEVSRLLVELGLARDVVGADRASLELPELALAADLGPRADDSARLAPALRADRAIGLGDAHGRALADALEAEGVPTTLLAPRSANEVVQAVHRLGDLLERPTRAAAVAARMTADVSQIAVRRDGRERLVAVWLLSRDPLRAVGGGGLLHELIELAGAENAFHGPLLEQVDTSASELASMKFDVLLDASGAAAARSPGAGARTVAVPPGLAQLPALDLVARVQALHALLYGEDAGAAPSNGRLTDAATGR
jgi:vitamin B12 transport system substrate-binding protein